MEPLTTRSRRVFLRDLALSAAAMAAPQGLVAAAAAAAPPNIVIILTDDQGWGDIRSHGNPQIDTPVLDRLAASGARFDRFYVSPVCAPTRASLLTGRYALRTGVSGVTHGKEIMHPGEVTVADILGRQGYATGCFGKWHNGAHYPYHPNGRGFDEFLGFCAGHWNNYFDTGLERNGEPLRTKGYINDVVTDAALAFIDKHRQRPFLCYIPYNTPHSPFQVPDRYFDEAKQRGLDDTLACVYGMCKNLDDNVRRILDRIEALGLTRKTIVFFFGDNGPNTARYNGDMRGRKGSVHEGGVRNSLFVRWPGQIAAGTVVRPITAHIDLLPTILELAGVAVPGDLALDGLSLRPLLRGDSALWPDRMLYSYWGRRGAVRTQQYRLIVERKRVELYDMVADPGQQQDVAAQHPDITRKLKAAYEAWFDAVNCGDCTPPPIPVGHLQMPCVELPAPECRLHGEVVFKGEKGWANDWITGWTRLEDSVSWAIDVVEAGSYAVTLLYTCPEEDVGSHVCVEAAGARCEGIVQPAHDPAPISSPDRVPRKEVYEKVWASLNLGVLSLPKGSTELRIRALSMAGESVMDLKAIQLRRIGAPG